MFLSVYSTSLSRFEQTLAQIMTQRDRVGIVLNIMEKKLQVSGICSQNLIRVPINGCNVHLKEYF